MTTMSFILIILRIALNPSDVATRGLLLLLLGRGSGCAVEGVGIDVVGDVKGAEPEALELAVAVAGDERVREDGGHEVEQRGLAVL